MVQVSYSDVFSISLEREQDEDIAPGDFVRTGPNLYPHYEVIAVSGDKAWLRNLQTAQDGVTLLNRCRKLNGEAGKAA